MPVKTYDSHDGGTAHDIWLHFAALLDAEDPSPGSYHARQADDESRQTHIWVHKLLCKKSSP